MILLFQAPRLTREPRLLKALTLHPKPCLTPLYIYNSHTRCLNPACSRASGEWGSRFEPWTSPLQGLEETGTIFLYAGFVAVKQSLVWRTHNWYKIPQRLGVLLYSCYTISLYGTTANTLLQFLRPLYLITSFDSGLKPCC